MNRKITIAILLAVTLVLVLWDIWVYVIQPEYGGGTISEVVLGFARRHPVLPFAIGVVCGHLLWPQKPKATT